MSERGDAVGNVILFGLLFSTLFNMFLVLTLYLRMGSAAQAVPAYGRTGVQLA